MTPQQKRRAQWERDYKRARLARLQESQGRCERCGSNAEVVHHKAGRRHPESNAIRNLAALCSPCHAHVHANPAESYEQGWLIHWEDAS